MKSFNEIINSGISRLGEEERQSLKPTGHVPDDENGVFKVDKLKIIVTVDRDKNETMEYISISKDNFKRPGMLEIGKVIQLFWYDHEINDVCRLGIKSNIIHLRRIQRTHYMKAPYASKTAIYS